MDRSQPPVAHDTSRDACTLVSSSEAHHRVALYATVSRRLVIALTVLMTVFSIAMAVPSIRGGRALVFPIVLAAGFIGGFVSLQRRLKRLSYEDLQLLSASRVYIWLSPFVGGIFASLLYLLFLTGLLSDAVFPHFSYDEAAGVEDLARLFHMRSKEPTEYAKLFFWSFVAGFSEMFVVNVIEKFSQSAVYTAAPTPPTVDMDPSARTDAAPAAPHVPARRE